jgi:RNA polymerase sigma-70 factor, ECF subfamily
MTRSPEEANRPQSASSSAEAEAASFRDGLVEMIPVLRAFARSLCGHRDMADDLAQETLAKAWQARDRFQPGTNLKAWLFVILRNEFYSNHRRAKTAADYTAAYAHSGEGVEAEQHAKLDLMDLMRAFNLLAPEQKEALMLTASDFSYEEAAAICGCAVGTIKSRLSRARKQLQLLIEGDGAALPDRKERADDFVDALFPKFAQPGSAKQLR